MTLYIDSQIAARLCVWGSIVIGVALAFLHDFKLAVASRRSYGLVVPPGGREVLMMD